MDVDGEDDPGLETINASVTTALRSLATFQPIQGSSATLDRKGNRHEVSAHAVQLPSGHIVALFYVAFNDPQNCTNPIPGMSQCSQPDSTNPATDASLLWADGDQADSRGKANFSATIGLGTAGAPGEILFGRGLIDVNGSEVHYLVRDKGLPIAGRETEQATTYGGGCDVATCQDLQFAIFPAPH
jgi:hypothetical protein